MELGTSRLEPSARIEERPFGSSPEEQKRRRHARPAEALEADSVTDEEILSGQEPENHQLDDLA
jgi:hypothetical protein